MNAAALFHPISLRAHNLGCDRGGQPIFRGVNFTIKEGEALILRGDNGAGKTSLLRLIAGLVPISEGQLEVLDGDGLEGDGALHHNNAAGLVAWQGHEEAHKAALTVTENLRFWAQLHNPGADIGAALERVGLVLLAQMQAGQLSAGQKRRLALARLLIEDQPLWLMDEPTAALDDGATNMCEGLVANHLRLGGIAIIATHSKFSPKGKVSALNLVAA